MSEAEAHSGFGHAFRSHFLFSDDYLPLNHGSFGAFPRFVQEAQRSYQHATESQPDRFIRYDALNHISNSRLGIAKLLKTSSDECVFVQNATVGLNTILRNLLPTFASQATTLELTKREQSCVVYFDTIYGAIEKTLFSIREIDPSIELRKVTNYTLPCSHEAIVTALVEVLDKASQDGVRVRACVFETITSVPAARFPFQAITTLCRERGIYSVIDGAHGVGQIALSLGDLSPDFFVSNCHKWLYTPRGCAVLYVPRRNQHLIRTTVPTSWGFEALPFPPEHTDMSSNSRNKTTPDEQQLKPQEIGPSYFTGLFDYMGTVENSAFFCVNAALNFRQTVCGGDEAIWGYIQYIAQAGADLIAERLGTEVMDVIEPEESTSPNTTPLANIRQCAMANIRLPFAITGSENTPATTSLSKTPTPQSIAPASTDSGFTAVPIRLDELVSHTSWLQSTLIKEYRIGITVYPYASRAWLRVSGQIYLELSDFEKLAEVVKVVLERIRNGESGIQR
ncbi:hypothetical protein LTR84_008180 [Exophiala bonariae]|uniref:Aminotransferase class V domain-containing protein n=1 Tax=Exophiala bonariae TaxID=1690606 RepID=A0AAV9MY17_9EURO|nr:hypothetical protein LTR84_008180 [Exophiala bonariae]